MGQPSETEQTAAPGPAPRIVSTPGTCGGKPRIDGHRIKVQDVVLWHVDMGRSIEDILEGYPGLDRAKIEVALAYYEAHREEIRAALKRDEEIVRRVGADAHLDPRTLSAEDRCPGTSDSTSMRTAIRTSRGGCVERALT